MHIYMYLSLNEMGKILVLPQLDMPGFLDFPWKALLFLRSELRGDRKELGRGDEMESWLICKTNLKWKKFLKRVRRNEYEREFSEEAHGRCQRKERGKYKEEIKYEQVGIFNLFEYYTVGTWMKTSYWILLCMYFVVLSVNK